MAISLQKAGIKDAALIHSMQIKSFLTLLEKYQDFDTNPGNEKIEKVIERLNQPFSDYYLILKDGVAVGAIRIVKSANRRYRVSPVFILPEYQGQGIAQKVFQLIEDSYNDADSWELSTIQQEPGNCHLYEKIGYRLTGWEQVVNTRMTLVAYQKFPPAKQNHLDCSESR